MRLTPMLVVSTLPSLSMKIIDDWFLPKCFFLSRKKYFDVIFLSK